MPPVSKVFQSCEQTQRHRLTGVGDQSQVGQRIRGSAGAKPLSSRIFFSRTGSTVVGKPYLLLRAVLIFTKVLKLEGNHASGTNLSS
jgi:hypothetical protein